MNERYFKNLKKAKQEFISKRCDEITKNYCKAESFEILQSLMEKLKGEEKRLFIEYTEKIAVEHFQNEERIYSLGFSDGVMICLDK